MHHHSQPAPSLNAYTPHGSAPSHNAHHYTAFPHGPQQPLPHTTGGVYQEGHCPSLYGAGGHHNHGDGTSPQRRKYGMSSLFVPADWNFDSSKAGFANLIARIFTSIDHQYNSMEHLPMYSHHGAAYGAMHRPANMMGRPNGMGSYYAPSVSHHSFHPAAAHGVSIASDPHGLFSLANMARLNASHGHARFSSKSTPTVCPRCKRNIMTMVKRRPDGVNITATAAAVIFSLIFKLPKALLPLTFLPLQLRSLQPCIHYCSFCNYKLGKNIRVYIPVEADSD